MSDCHEEEATTGVWRRASDDEKLHSNDFGGASSPVRNEAADGLESI
jgi:hypothetical protein